MLAKIWVHCVPAALVCALAAPACALEAKQVRSDKHNFNVVPLVEGLQNPWSIAWLPDGRMLVTERAGRLRIVSKDFKLDPKPVEGLPKIRTALVGGSHEPRDRQGHRRRHRPERRGLPQDRARVTGHEIGQRSG